MKAEDIKLDAWVVCTSCKGEGCNICCNSECNGYIKTRIDLDWLLNRLQVHGFTQTVSDATIRLGEDNEQGNSGKSG